MGGPPRHAWAARYLSPREGVDLLGLLGGRRNPGGWARHRDDGAWSERDGFARSQPERAFFNSGLDDPADPGGR
jgi:hypothetical protein